MFEVLDVIVADDPIAPRGLLAGAAVDRAATRV